MDLSAYIESILFFKGGPVSLSYLAKVLGKNEDEVRDALNVLEKRIEGGGLVLTRHQNEVSLGTNPKSSGFIEALIKEDLDKDIGKAGLETLSIIIYRGPISRGEIDYIRGVNSSFILRNLIVRGLVERDKTAKDQRVSLYKPTFKLLSFLGVKSINEMPEYNSVKEKIENFESEKIEENGGGE